MVKLVVLRDIWTDEGRQRAGKVIEIKNMDTALDLVEAGLARRLKDEDEVKTIDASGIEKVVKKAGEPVKRKRGRPRKKTNGADT